MGQRSQYQMGQQQRERRKKKRDRLAKKGANLNDIYYGKFYIKLGDK